MTSLLGITPAYAGKSMTSFRPFDGYRDHPRVCGEKLHGKSCLPWPEGSPPRMRGKGSFCSTSARVPGITPAYAGKRSWQPSTRKPATDHPRVCGEKLQQLLFVHSAEGSPPRMRGKAARRISNGLCGGITPAYAGKSRRRSARGQAQKDHPRVCGEKMNSFQCSQRMRGSPPRMRGKAAAASFCAFC